MVFVDLLKRLLRDKELGKYIVPIIPDEARTFGMEALFTRYGIYSNVGQLYEPVDANTLTAYREAKNGQILEEGITEAGSMSSLHRRRHGLRQPRAADDSVLHLLLDVRLPAHRRPDLGRRRHALPRLPAGRHRGPHHADGRRPAAPGRPLPPARGHGAERVSYDPAFAYELALIVQDGIRRMYEEGENIFYYITLCNENYPMEPMPAGVAEGILKRHVPLPAGALKQSEGEIARASARQRRDPARGAARQEFWRRSTASPPTSGA